ncbi:swr1 complex component [Rhizophlyctis rosea]|nr:swr1 complex component [Rhizophlyctis rosea]
MLPPTPHIAQPSRTTSSQNHASATQSRQSRRQATNHDAEPSAPSQPPAPSDDDEEDDAPLSVRRNIMMTPLERRKRQAVESKKQELRKVLDGYDTSLRELYYLDSNKPMLEFDPVRLKLDKSEKMMKFLAMYDLWDAVSESVIDTAATSSSRVGTRHAINKERQTATAALSDLRPFRLTRADLNLPHHHNTLSDYLTSFVWLDDDIITPEEVNTRITESASVLQKIREYQSIGLLKGLTLSDLEPKPPPQPSTHWSALLEEAKWWHTLTSRYSRTRAGIQSKVNKALLDFHSARAKREERAKEREEKERMKRAKVVAGEVMKMWRVVDAIIGAFLRRLDEEERKRVGRETMRRMIEESRRVLGVGGGGGGSSPVGVSRMGSVSGGGGGGGWSSGPGSPAGSYVCGEGGSSSGVYGYRDDDGMSEGGGSYMGGEAMSSAGGSTFGDDSRSFEGSARGESDDEEGGWDVEEVDDETTMAAVEGESDDDEVEALAREAEEDFDEEFLRGYLAYGSGVGDEGEGDDEEVDVNGDGDAEEEGDAMDLDEEETEADAANAASLEDLTKTDEEFPPSDDLHSDIPIPSTISSTSSSPNPHSAASSPHPHLDDTDFDIPTGAGAEEEDDETTMAAAEGEEDSDEDEVEALEREAEEEFDEEFLRGYLAFGRAGGEGVEGEEGRDEEAGNDGGEGKREGKGGGKGLVVGSEEMTTEKADAMEIERENPIQPETQAVAAQSSNESPPTATNDQQPTSETQIASRHTTPIPFLLRGTLREYQRDGLDWLAGLYDKGLNGILADEMGLGKTIQTIALLAHLACHKGVWGPHLIIVPTSVMLNWDREFKTWCPAFKLLTYYGTQLERQQKRVGWTKKDAFHVVITSYQLVIKDHAMFRRKKWEYLILDEAHHIKNFRSLRWRTLLGFKSERRLLVTGTPLQNRLVELWSLMYFLMPGEGGVEAAEGGKEKGGGGGGGEVGGGTTAGGGGGMITKGFATMKEFQEWFSVPVDKLVSTTDTPHATSSAETVISALAGDDSSTQDPETQSTITQLHSLLRPYILRRLKHDVEKQLPCKYEHVVRCRLSKRQRFLYDEFMSRTKTREELRSGRYMGVLSVLMQLRKVCNHPDLFEVREVVGGFCAGVGVVGRVGGEVLGVCGRLGMFREEGGMSARLVLGVGRGREGFWEGEADVEGIGRGIEGMIAGAVEVERKAWSVVEGLKGEGRNVEAPYGSLEVWRAVRRWKDAKEEVEKWEVVRSVWKARRGGGVTYVAGFVRLLKGLGKRAVDPGGDERADLLKRLGLIITYGERCERLKDLVDRFAVVTPRVVVFTPTYRTTSGVDASKLQQEISLLDGGYTKHIFNLPPAGLFDRVVEDGTGDGVCHVAETRLTLSFPDKRLLQFDCGKLQTLDRLLRDFKRGGHRALIFTQMTRMLDILEIFLNIHGHRYLRLDGATKPEARQTLMERFNRDERILCFILSTRSGGVGMNLTGADAVVFYDSDWNPAMDAQAQDRAHRIGQTREVHIYRLISEHTIEENILRKTEQKRRLDDLVIKEGEFNVGFLKRLTGTGDGTPGGGGVARVDWRDWLDEGMVGGEGEGEGEEAEAAVGEGDDENAEGNKDKGKQKMKAKGKKKKGKGKKKDEREWEMAMVMAEDEDDVVALRGAREEMEVDAVDFEDGGGAGGSRIRQDEKGDSDEEESEDEEGGGGGVEEGKEPQDVVEVIPERDRRADGGRLKHVEEYMFLWRIEEMGLGGVMKLEDFFG